MDLPSHCFQWLVIISIADDYPRQAITAVNASGAAVAERTMTIIDSNLRHRSEQKFPEQLKFRECGEYRRHDTCSNNVGDHPLSRREGEHSIRAFDQAAGESDAFGLIAVEERAGRAAFENCLQFPSKIDRITNAGVHTLSTGRAVDVGRVAEQEARPFRKRSVTR